MASTIRNPIEWTVDQVRLLAVGAGSTGYALGHLRDTVPSAPPRVRRIGLAELREALAQGLEDFGACRTDVIFLCAFYPIAGLVLGRVVFGTGLLPLLFPLAAGFALLGPLVAIGLQ